MTKLSDTQLMILSAAAQRANLLVLPLPQHLKGGAAQKVIASLLKQGLIEEIEADLRAGEHVWRETGDGHGVTLAITEAGFAAIGVEPHGSQTTSAKDEHTRADIGDDSCAARSNGMDAATISARALDTAATAAGETGGKGAASEPEPGPRTRIAREGTKQAALVAMLRAPEGATISEIASATGWQPHTVRGAIAGALKKKLGLAVVSEKIKDRGRVYRLSS